MRLPGSKPASRSPSKQNLKREAEGGEEESSREIVRPPPMQIPGSKSVSRSTSRQNLKKEADVAEGTYPRPQQIAPAAPQPADMTTSSYVSSEQESPITPDTATLTRPPPAASFNPSTASPLTSKAFALAKKEEELRQRELRLAQLEARGGEVPNWPKFKPIIRHDIQNDIPMSGRGIVKRLYAGWYISCSSYFLNFLGAFALIAIGASNGGANFALALFFLVIGVPISFVFWYRSLYRAVKDDSNVHYWMFFFNYIFHLGSKIIMVLGIPGWGGVGIIYIMQTFPVNLPVACICVIASCVTGFEVIYGIWQLKAVYEHKTGKKLGESAKKPGEAPAMKEAPRA